MQATPKTILVVEDESSIASAVAARLRADGHRVTIADDGLRALDVANELQPDLVVLDLMLPGLDGLEVCTRLQAERAVPILMLTARDSEADMLTGLRAGADDYMTKPFSARELAARVNALLRRVDRIAADFAAAGPGQPVTRRVGAYEIDIQRRRVTGPDGTVHLTPTEFDLFAHLAGRNGDACSREELLASVWGYPSDSETRTVDSHVRALRRKLDDDAIRTVRGFGYAVDTSEVSV